MTEPGDSPPIEVGTSVGRFQIRARLGAGGMGEVYLAEDTQLKRPVALKRMAKRLGADERYRQRFLREAQMASRLNSPYIAAIYDVFEHQGEIFLVMEYVEGQPLRRLLHAAMKPGQFLPMAIECARALAAAHAGGVLHRDIKPENIMITPSGHVKILDFGLARKLGHLDETVSFETGSGSLAGTAGYVAPEVLTEGEPDERSDMFALGVVFYEALSGKHPFRAETFLSTSNRVMDFEPPPLEEVNRAVPEGLSHIIVRMLAKDPNERYPTAAELAAELNLLERQSSSGMITPRARRPRWFPRPGWRTKPAALAILVLAILAGLTAVRPIRRKVEGWLGAGEKGRQKQVAVLPFQALGGTAADQAFAAGLTETVTARLAALSLSHALEVVPASEVFSKKVTSPDLARREFGVNLALTGSLEQAGNRVRVAYALINTESERQISARTITAPANDPFKVEDDVADGALGLLQVELQPGERKGFDEHGTAKPTAYGFYLRGMGYLQNYEQSENVSNSIADFEQALKVDPNYARAFAGLGQAYWQQYLLTEDAKWTAMGRESCERAMGLDPHLAAAMTCLGTVANGTGNYPGAVRQFQKALAADPSSDRAYLGLAAAYEKLGRTAEAEKTYQRAIGIRPGYWAGYSWLGIFYFHQGRYADARRMFEHVIALVPDSFTGYYDLGGVYAQEGKFAQAVPPLERSIAIRPTDTAYTNLGTAYFFLHEYNQAVINFRKAVELSPHSYMGWRNLGDGYYWTPGKRGEAAGAYQKAIRLAHDALEVNPRDAYAYEIQAICQAMVGEKGAALRSLRRAQEFAKGDPEISYAAALIRARNGDRAGAMKWLGKALKGGYSIAIVRNDPALNSLHGMEGFPGSAEESAQGEKK